MGRSEDTKEEAEDEAAIMRRMDEALKKALSTPPETHADMVKRRRGQNKQKRAAPPRKPDR